MQLHSACHTTSRTTIMEAWYVSYDKSYDNTTFLVPLKLVHKEATFIPNSTCQDDILRHYGYPFSVGGN